MYYERNPCDSAFWKGFKFGLLTIIIVLILLFLLNKVYGDNELWKVTAYCSCKKCCGKSDGITASGYKAKLGYVACNWLPFKTELEIKKLGCFIVMDRGAKSLFGDKNNPIKHLDIWFPTHKDALNFGVRYMEVKIIKKCSK